jgi:uncharacterized protein YjiS (DUF1127 family)
MSVSRSVQTFRCGDPSGIDQNTNVTFFSSVGTLRQPVHRMIFPVNRLWKTTMSLESESLDVNAPFPPAIALRGIAQHPNFAPSRGSAVMEQSVGQIRSSAESGWSASHPVPPRDLDMLWLWLCKAASWFLAFAIEGFAQYGHAMYPGLIYPEEHGDGYAGTMKSPCEGVSYGQHENDLHLTSLALKRGAAAKLNAFEISKMSLAVVPAIPRRMAAGLARLSLGLRHGVEARRQAELLSSFNDHLLRDIGVARDQIDLYTHQEYYGG